MKNYITKSNIKKLARLTKPTKTNLKKFSPEDFISLGIWAITILMYILGALIMLGAQKMRVAGLVLLPIQMITTITLLTVKFNLANNLKDHGHLLKWPASLLALAVTVLSSICADSLIIESTSLGANNFPAAQRVLTLIGASAAYIYFFILLVAIVYVIQSFKIITLTLGETKIARILMIILHIKSGNKINIGNEIALMVGTAFLIMAPLIMQQQFLSKDNLLNNIKKVVIFSSFPGRSEMCGLAPNENVAVSILQPDKAAYAVVDNKGGYHFKIDECKSGMPSSTPSLKIQTLLRT